MFVYELFGGLCFCAVRLRDFYAYFKQNASRRRVRAFACRVVLCSTPSGFTKKAIMKLSVKNIKKTSPQGLILQFCNAEPHLVVLQCWRGDFVKLFILEDDDAIAMGLSYSLKNEGYDVTVAKSVKSAYEILNKEAFSLYILDLTLPDGSGYDVCREIKSVVTCPLFFNGLR